MANPNDMLLSIAIHPKMSHELCFCLQIPGWLFILLSIISIPLQAAPETQNPLPDLKFVTIPTGQFIMGTADLSEALADLPTPESAMIEDETPAHIVVFEKPFQLSQTEVTQKTWLNIMHSKPGPAENWQADNWQQLPVVSISWNAANQFIDRLTEPAIDQATLSLTNRGRMGICGPRWQYRFTAFYKTRHG